MGMDRSLGNRTALNTLLAAAALIVVPLSVPAVSDSSPAEITTDTPAYCRQLFERVSQLIGTASLPPPVTVSSLSTEGHKLCDEGHTRPGILRLRRALMLLEQGDQAP